jgi:hypothetical protein
MRRLTRPAIGCLSFVHLLFVFCPIATTAQESSVQLPGAVHIDALDTGEGQTSIAEAVSMVDQAGLGIAIITPHDQSVVEYGLPPLRNLLKVKISRESIQDFGVERFIENIRSTDEAVPGVITIDGAEAIPAYYWDRGVLSGLPTVRNLHKHMLIIGLPSAESYAQIPSITNGFPHEFGLFCVLSFWPAPVILIGLLMIIRARRHSVIDDPRSIKSGLLTAVIGGLFFANSVPFCSPFDVYHGDQGEKPYQAVIDYANEQGAMTFWAHPEVTNRIPQSTPWPASILADSVIFETSPYNSSLLNTTGYTGFAIFEAGMRVIGKPGGIWDQVLLEYCAGLRKKPIWAIAELDFELRPEDHGVTTSQTVFQVKENSREGVLNAMRDGAMYARRAPGERLSVPSFTVSGSSGAPGAEMGGHVRLAESPRILFHLKTATDRPQNLKILILRGSDVIRTVSTTRDTTVIFEDPVHSGSGTTYYRCIVMLNEWPVLATNPIFVTINIPVGQQTKP